MGVFQILGNCATVTMLHSECIEFQTHALSYVFGAACSIESNTKLPHLLQNDLLYPWNDSCLTSIIDVHIVLIARPRHLPSFHTRQVRQRLPLLVRKLQA